MKLLSSFKYAFIAGLISCGSFSAAAQSTYLQASTGYNFSIAELTDDSEMSYGKGITPAVTVGRMFTNGIGAELSIGYLFGSKYESKNTFKESYGPYNQTRTKTAEIAKYSRMVLFQPSFVVSGDNTGTTVYAKFGPVIGLGKIHEKYKEYAEGSTLERNLELRGGAALGGQTTFGVNFNAGAKNAFFAEANLKLLWYSPTNGEVVKFIRNGEDRTAEMSVRGREVVYVKSPNNHYGDYSSPTQMPKQNHPFSSAGFNIGIKHTF